MRSRQGLEEFKTEVRLIVKLQHRISPCLALAILLHYSTWHTAKMYRPLNVEGFFKNLGTLLNDMKNRAAAGGSLRKYAMGNASAPGFTTIYALVQWTPDLSQVQCNNCLDVVYGNFQSCCAGKVGARVVGLSCSVRYEVYLFSESTDDSPTAVLAPARSNNSTSTLSQGNISCRGLEFILKGKLFDLLVTDNREIFWVLQGKRVVTCLELLLFLC